MPWLWDIDTGFIRSRQESGFWDWESLVRLLSVPDEETLQLPPSLRNSRRIWRILKEARVGDLSASPKSNPPDMSRSKRNMPLETSRISLPPPSSAINSSSLVKSTSSFRTVSRNGIVLRFPPRPHRLGFT